MKLKILTGTLLFSILTNCMTYYYMNNNYKKEISDTKLSYEQKINKLNSQMEDREEEINKIIENNNEIVNGLNKEIEQYKNKIDTLNKMYNNGNNNNNSNSTVSSKTRTSNNVITTTATLSYYTNCPEENAGYTTTCTGAEPKNGMIASNYWPLGTKVIIDGKTYTVADRGGKSFNKSNRFDVFVERLSGESNQQYRKRVLEMGKRTVEVQIIQQ